MNLQLYNIKDFLNIRNECTFCKCKLTPVIKDFLSYGKSIPIFNSKIKYDYIEYGINYNSSSLSFKNKAIININTNTLTFNNINSSIYVEDVIDIIESNKPHIELVCNNKSCKMNYYICSSSFECKKENLKEKLQTDTVITLKPISVFWECCNVDKFWIQNNWYNNSAKIYFVCNPNYNPVDMPFINFHSINESMLRTKVKTILIFG